MNSEDKAKQSSERMQSIIRERIGALEMHNAMLQATVELQEKELQEFREQYRSQQNAKVPGPR